MEISSEAHNDVAEAGILMHICMAQHLNYTTHNFCISLWTYFPTTGRNLQWVQTGKT